MFFSDAQGETPLNKAILFDAAFHFIFGTGGGGAAARGAAAGAGAGAV